MTCALDIVSNARAEASVRFVTTAVVVHGNLSVITVHEPQLHISITCDVGEVRVRTS